MQECKDIPAVQEMLVKAEKVLGYDLLTLCLEGPKEKLDDTVYSQPALFVAGLLADTHPDRHCLLQLAPLAIHSGLPELERALTA